jgi:hypothetical protein
MISSIKKFLNIDNLTPVKYTKLSDAKHINVTYKLEYNDKCYAVRICDKDYYSFLKEVSYIFKDTSPPVLYTDDEECIIINEWVNNKKGYTIEDLVNSIKEMQKIKEIPTNKFYNDILYTNYEWLEEESFKNYHKRWYSLYFKINDYLKKNLEIVVCHNDFHNENTIYNGEKLKVIDLELVSYNHCYTDLAQQSSYFDKEQLLKEYYTGTNHNINENTHILYNLAIIEYFLYYSFMIRRLNDFTNFYEIGLNIKRFKDFDQTGLNLLDDRYNFIASLVMGFEAEELIKEFNTKYSNIFNFD